MFTDINKTCANFIQRIMRIIDNPIPWKTKQITGALQDWFDNGIAEKISKRDKLFLKIQRKKKTLQCYKISSKVKLKKH